VHGLKGTKKAKSLLRRRFPSRHLSRDCTFYHITYGPRVQKHSAINRKNGLVKYRYLFPRFFIITCALLQTGHKWCHLWWRFY